MTGTTHIDCESCPGRGRACDGCVVAVMLDPRPTLDDDMAAAITALHEGGLIDPPHLALVTPPPPRPLRVVQGPGRRRAG